MKILVIGSCASTKRKIPCTARELYMGRQHLLTCQAIDKLREQYEVDFYILSALHGFVEENTILEPYNRTWSTMSRSKILEETVELKDQFKELVSQYDVVFLLLSKSYLWAISDVEYRYENVYAISSDNTRKLINCHQIILAKDDDKRIGAARVYLKGVVFLNLVEEPELEDILKQFNE